MAIFSLGNLGSTWFQVVAPPCLKISAICLKFRVSRNWFLDEVTMARPSRPTRNSWYLMPLAAQACFSSSLMAREASEMSVSPLQNVVTPPPVPEVPTVTLTPDSCLLNSSVMASLIGATVEEPSITIEPERPVRPLARPPAEDPPIPIEPERLAPPLPPPPSSSPPQAVATRAMARARPSSQLRRVHCVIRPLPPALMSVGGDGTGGC